MAAKIPDTKKTNIICRNGSTIDSHDLEIVNPHDARSIIIIAPEDNEPDISVIKTILALTNNPERKQGRYHIVAEVSEPKNKEVAEMIGNNEVTLIHSDDLVSRVIVQTCRQSGLSIVYTELLGFEGDEIYFHEEAGLVGKTFKEGLMCYEESSLMGIRFRDGGVKINPPMETVFQNGDKVIAISEDDDTVTLSGKIEFNIDEHAFATGEEIKETAENTLVLGWNRRAPSIIMELDSYLAKGSGLTIVAQGEGVEIGVNDVKKSAVNQKITFIEGNISERGLLDSLGLEKFNHIILLCYSDSLPEQEADSKTLITLLHLRNIEQKTGNDFSIVSEMMDIRNKELAEITEADDFIISNRLISLMLAQLSENAELKAVFDDIFDSDGSEIYMKPATDYIIPGKTVNFYSVTESAARKGEIAIGYRISKLSNKPDKTYGVVVNPKKSEMITFTEKDKIIVVAEE
jgi:Trk K+ transport system NAD-binding subunit